MKKKILIALFVVLMVCLFAFSVNAANEVTLTDGTTADLATVFKINASNQITGFNTGYDKNMVTDVIFPDEIEGLEANLLFNSATNLNSLTFAATDTFFISGDGIFSKCSVKTITFNSDCVVEIRKGNFSNCTSLTQITFPKFKKLAASSFAGCSNMVATNELVFAEGMTEIGGHAFNGCTSLTGTVYFPSTLQTINEYSFQKTGFTYFDLSKCANLTAVGGGYGGPFNNNDQITTLDLSACVNLKDLKGSFAESCDNLTEVILPPNLENIPSKSFAHCYQLQSIVLPATMKTIADEAFHSARKNQTIKTFTVYVQSNVQFGVSYPFRDSSAKIEYVLIGDGVTAQSFIAANTFTGVTGATVVDYLDPASPWTYTVGQTITSHTIIENYCTPLALTGEHSSDDNPCVINCTYCGLVAAKENPIHKESISIAYENGYDREGVKIITCTNMGCGHEESVKAEALFVCQGYSTPEDGRYCIAIGYSVNIKAIEEYQRVTGSTLNYGIFAVAFNNIGNNDIVNADGSHFEKAIAAEVSSINVAAFELRINGFETENHKNAELTLGAYVIETDKDSDKTVSYLQHGTPNDGDRYSYVTYNGLTGTEN